MFELIWGIILIAIFSVVTYMMIFSYNNIVIGTVKSILFLGLFWIYAICLTIKGFIKVIKNILTAMFGENCYGKILRTRDSGARLGNKSQLIADILVYIPSLQETKILSETVGFDLDKYKVDSFVKLKYYKGDINFKNSINISELPVEVEYEFEKYNRDNIDSENESIASIAIDDVEYIQKELQQVNGPLYKQEYINYDSTYSYVRIYYLQ